MPTRCILDTCWGGEYRAIHRGLTRDMRTNPSSEVFQGNVSRVVTEGIQRLLARWVLEWALIVFQVLYFSNENTQRRAAQVGDCSCSPSNRVSSEMLFLGVSLAVKTWHVNSTSCRKSPGYFSSCISPGDSQGVQGSYLCAVTLQTLTHSLHFSEKMKACKAFPWPGLHSLATSTPTALQIRLPIHRASYTNSSAATGGRCARDPSINPAVQAAASQGQQPSTGASTDPATNPTTLLSNTKFTMKPMGKGD